MTMDEVAAKAQSGPTLAKMAGVVAGRQERKSAKGNRFAFVQLSDPTGAYEVTLFSEALEKSRDFLETGAKVVVTADATMEADQLKLLGRSIAPADIAVADAGAVGLKIYIDTPDVVATVATVISEAAANIKSGPKGPILFTLLHPELPGEVNMDTGVEYPLNPQIKGAIKSLNGVLQVEDA
jgi:DNA polymerase-3 subunit alpha